ncbi:MAG: YggS family pyridoxal phosphate-dependent enzyme [Candidatus Omnitrophica bacterium]|nr:YggS family pyridoxal phosphate-dependent enzyme [Candidatus Omnitrophota bacterium]
MIKDNIERVKERIRASCSKTGSNPERISIVCVTKGQPIESISELAGLGYKDIGENKVQEALFKFNQISGLKWHMIGHLQTNKVKEAVKVFDLIHSVDSLNLAEEINKQALKVNKVQEILIEVKTSPEETKFGVSPVDLEEISTEAAKLGNLKVKGLMTIAPLAENIEETRKYFALTRKLRDKINPGWLLSMGMSDDFEVAIEEGADIIRIGRAIFNG